MRGDFVHGEILAGDAYLTTLGDLMDSAYRADLAVISHSLAEGE